MNPRVGRPSLKQPGCIDRFGQVGLRVHENPDASANEIHAAVGGRRTDVLRMVALAKWLSGCGERPTWLVPGSQKGGGADSEDAR
jgi:hypothetical protein